MKKLLRKKVNLFGKSIPVFVIALLGIAMVSATLLSYFGVIAGTFGVTQGLLVDGKGMDDSASLTATYSDFTSLEATRVISNPHTLHNTVAGVNANVDLNSECTNPVTPNSCTDADIEIMGTLELTKKTVDFTENSPPWVILGEKVQIKYMIVGEVFTAEVTTGAISGYELIYYKDAETNRFSSPEMAIELSAISGNLPYAEDGNAEEYDYCALVVGSETVSEYNTCHGAKIWYVPSEAIIGGNIDWSRASEFYFESSLIQYNAEGKITVYPTEVLDFTIEGDFPLMTYPGTYTITTTVDSQI